jgi:hypothetical protein
MGALLCKMLPPNGDDIVWRSLSNFMCAREDCCGRVRGISENDICPFVQVWMSLALLAHEKV